jgi:hypothetical protein
MEIHEIKHALDAINLRLETAEYQNILAKITLYRVMTGNWNPITDELADKIEKASIDYGKDSVRLICKGLEILAEKKYE